MVNLRMRSIKMNTPRSRFWIGLPLFMDDIVVSKDGVTKLITETSSYSFGNFRKLSLYNCFMPV